MLSQLYNKVHSHKFCYRDATLTNPPIAIHYSLHNVFMLKDVVDDDKVTALERAAVHPGLGPGHQLLNKLVAGVV